MGRIDPLPFDQALADWRKKSHPLVTAQNTKRCGPYLLQQLQEGQPLRKWRVRQEEKHTAKQYANGQVLLNDLYEKKSQQMLTV